MRAEKEILNALNILKEVCEENKGYCNKCVLRNGKGGCGILNNSYDDMYDSPQEWNLREEDRPRLILS